MTRIASSHQQILSRFSIHPALESETDGNPQSHEIRTWVQLQGCFGGLPPPGGDGQAWGCPELPELLVRKSNPHFRKRVGLSLLSFGAVTRLLVP